MKTLENYENLTPCEFFNSTPVRRCLIQFIRKYGGGGGAGSVESFNSRTGAVTLLSSDVTTALGYTPSQVTSGNNFAIAATDSSGNIIDGSGNVVTRPLTGFVTDGNTAIVATDTILVAFNKTQGQIDARITLTSPITGFAVGANSTVLASDTLLAALGKIQGQMNARITTATTFTGYTVGANTALSTSDNILTALGKIQGQINARAPLASPALTGTPTAPTAATGTNTTQLATTAFVQAEIASDALLLADFEGGQSPFTADGTTTVFNITHNLGAIPSYFTLTTTEPISSNHLNRTITFPDNNTLRITFALAPLVGEDANYVWVVFR